MLINDIVSQFYKDIQLKAKERGLIIVTSIDVDALCATSILKTLLTIDQIPFSVYPIANRHEYGIYYNEKFETEDNAIIVCINHSADFDILSSVMNDTIQFWIIDSHRPINVNNAYNANQVKVICNEKDAEEIPQFSDVIDTETDESEVVENLSDIDELDDENLDNENEDSCDSNGKRKIHSKDRDSKRSKLESRLEKNIRKKEWDTKREQILIDYDEFIYFSSSVSFLMCELAIKLSKETNETLWLALIGITSQYIENKIERDLYMEGIAYLKGHVSRLNRQCEETEPNLTIAFSNELVLPLLRHWNVYDSMQNSSTIIAAFNLCSHDGKNRLNGFLADLGLPITQCQKSFVAMELDSKENFENEFRVQLNRYQLEETELFLPSFVINFKMHGQFSVLDFYYLINGCLLNNLKNITSEEDGDLSNAFFAANNSRNLLDFLTLLKSTSKIKESVSLGIEVHSIIMETVRSFVNKALICVTASFLYVALPEDDKHIIMFQLPPCISSLARYTLEVYVRGSKNKRFRNLPLVLRIPCLSGGDYYCGIPPYNDNSCKNVLHSAFEQASKIIGFDSLNKLFDRNMLLMRSEDRSRFLDTLTTILE